MVGTRDGRKSTEHAARWAKLSHPNDIPGARRGIMWGDQDGKGGRGVDSPRY